MCAIDKTLKNYDKIREERDKIIKKLEAIKADIKAFMITFPDDNYTSRDGIKAIFRPQGTIKHKFDEKALLRDHPELADLIAAYTVPYTQDYFHVS